MFANLRLLVLLAVGALIFVLGGALWVQSGTIDNLRDEKAVAIAEKAVVEEALDTALVANAENLKTAERLKAFADRSNTLAEENARGVREAQAALDVLKLEVSNVPEPSPTEPGCRLPATQLVLDRLRDQSAPAPGDRADPARPARSSGHPVRLQGRAAGPEPGH